jgi:hypothetical protein
MAAALAAGVRDRRLFKIAYLGVFDDLADRADALYEAYRSPDSRVELEDRLAEAADLPPGSVLVHLPSPRMLLKLAEVRVLTQKREVVTLEQWDARHSRRAGALNEAHRRLWRIAIYVDPLAPVEKKDLLRSAAEDLFNAPSRYNPRAVLPSYVRAIFEQHAAREAWTIDDLRWLEATAALSWSDSPAATLEMIRAVLKRRSEPAH